MHRLRRCTTWMLVGVQFSHCSKAQISGQSVTTANVCFMPKAEIALGPRHVRFTPKSGHKFGRTVQIPQTVRAGIWRIIWNVRKPSEIRKADRCRERSSRKNGGFAKRASFRRRHEVAFQDNTLRMHGPDVMIAERLVKSVDELLRGGVLAACATAGGDSGPMLIESKAAPRTLR